MRIEHRRSETDQSGGSREVVSSLKSKFTYPWEAHLVEECNELLHRRRRMVLHIEVLNLTRYEPVDRVRVLWAAIENRVASLGVERFKEADHLRLCLEHHQAPCGLPHEGWGGFRGSPRSNQSAGLWKPLPASTTRWLAVEALPP